MSVRLSIFVSVLAIACWANPEAGQATALLAKQCGACHSGQVKLSGLDLSTREGLLKGGTKGPAVNLAQVDESLLLAAVHRRPGVAAMPPTKPLAPAEIALLERWLKAGAPWVEESAKPAAPTWWSFRPPQAPLLPAGVEGHAIDFFLDRTLAREGLTKAPAAPRAALLRRVYLDLTGLAPSAEAVQRFVADPDPNAFAKVVDALLASPRYGEKWARHWLDLVRYSDTAGFELDSYLADAWRYRDYVIDSFNADKPYDRFVKEQIAGDEYWPEDPEANTGTGLYCVGPNRDLFPDQADINRVEVLTDYTDTTAGVFLGLTAGCARCHDHKFDPIPQRDYYRLQAVFAPAVKTKVALNRLGSLGWERGENEREIQLREIGEQIRTIQEPCKKKLYAAKLAKLSEEVQTALQTKEDEKTPRQRELSTEYATAVRVTDEEIRGCLNESQTTALAKIERRLVRMFQGYAPKPFACGITDVGDYSPKTYVPAKGKAEPVAVQPGFFTALGGGDIAERSFERKVTGPIPMFPTTGRRHALAEWLTRPEHPLTARVLVNRVWQYHFGRGIVATPSDYGSRGAAPTHPELLDYLATRFVAQGWSMKKLHREILLSAAYQRSSEPAAGVRAKDPENLYLSHFRRRRLTSDELRDNLLAASGELNLKMHGKPVVPPLAEEEMFGMIGHADSSWVVSSNPDDFHRRSIYLFQKRTFRMPMMEVFDAPEPMLSCPRRDASTTAPQSLTLLNGSFARERARALAKRGNVEAIFRAVLLRAPDTEEANRLAASFAKLEAATGSREAALVEIARALLNTNEFLYVD